MIIQVADIKPNPFRFSGSFNRYPIDQKKVDSLKDSIKETSFWDNLLVRESPDGVGYEAAYGHHRLEALRQLGIKDIDVQIRNNIDDALMLRIMANENMDDWRTKPAVVVHTVEVANKFLKSEISGKEYGGLHKFMQTLFDGQHGLKSSQGHKRMGSRIVAKFLGKPWNSNHVDFAYKILDLEENGSVSREAIEEFDGMEIAKRFINNSKDMSELTPDEQIIIASDVKKNTVEGDGRRRDRVEEQFTKSVEKLILPKRRGADKSRLAKQLEERKQRILKPDWRKAMNEASSLTSKLQLLRVNLDTIPAVDVETLFSSLARLQDAIRELIGGIKDDAMTIESEFTRLS